MIYEVYKIIDDMHYFEGKGDLKYLKRILLCLALQGFTERDINIITIEN